MDKTAEDIRHSVEERSLSSEIVSIYRVGMADDSFLSDTDIVIVVPSIDAHERVRKQSWEAPFDVRGIYLAEEFPEEARFLPTASLTLVYGKQLLPPNFGATPKERAVKLATLFFTSFLRNFYECWERTLPVERVLKHLNDFVYVEAYAPELVTPELSSFLARIALARRARDYDEQKIKSLLKEGIDFSWDIVAALDNLLRSYREEHASPALFLGREPTIFLASGTGECRRASELFARWCSRAKILALPVSFATLLSGNDFAYHYTDRLLRRPPRGIARIKRFFKQCIAVFFWCFIRLS